MRFSIATYTYGYCLTDRETGKKTFCGFDELNDTIYKLMETK